MQRLNIDLKEEEIPSVRLLPSNSAARGRFSFAERRKMEDRESKHGSIYLHNLKEGNLQWRSHFGSCAQFHVTGYLPS